MEPSTCSSLASEASAVGAGDKAMGDKKLIYLSCFPSLYTFHLFKGSPEGQLSGIPGSLGQSPS